MTYLQAYALAKRRSLENKDKHFCIVVECDAAHGDILIDYTVRLGAKKGIEPCPDGLQINQCCAGSFINGDLWGL